MSVLSGNQKKIFKVFGQDSDLWNFRKQQRNAKKLLDGPPGLSKQASDDSMKRNIGDSLSVSGPPRSPSAIAVKGPDPKIDEFKRLSLDHNNTPGVIPLKRRAGLQPPIESKIRSDTRNSPKSRRTRGSSGGGIGGGGGVDGNGRDIDFDRGKIHPSKKLYDPNTPNTHNSAIGKSVSSRTQVSPGSRKHGVRSKCDTDTRKGPPRQSHFQTPSRSSDNAGNLQQLQTILNYVEEPVDKNDWDDEEPELLLQPETRPISNDQLVQEVKGIYAGLVLVERKCMEIDEKQLSIAQDPDQTKRLPLTAEQWLALIALHKTLLHEHHDFFLASQHPSASEALMKLAEKYTMPARMWKHAIHAFLEVLRHHLPASYEFMLTFLNISYSMMALLLETVPMFEDIWVESLGDLSRYRMAIADNDQRDGDVWAGVARTWYGRAANKHPEVSFVEALANLVHRTDDLSFGGG